MKAMYKKILRRIKSIDIASRIKSINITKNDMLSFLKVSNLILITTAIMLCISLIMFKEHKWEYVNGAAVLLWMNLMFLIMSGAYYFYFLFQFKGENWINFKEDTVEEFMKIGNPNIPTHSSPNEDDANNPQITRMNEQLDELLGPKDIPLTIINNQ